MAERSASSAAKNESGSSESSKKLQFLVELSESDSSGSVCVKVKSVSGTLTSRNGWKYRRMIVNDSSLEAEVLISEANFEEWKFKSGDFVACSVRSNGLDNEGRLAVFFNAFLGPFEIAEILYEINEDLHKIGIPGGGRMKPSETVYQISAREARSLLGLIRLWIDEEKPQHYTKWCQMHQIVATNLFYMGLVKRTGSMSGYYYPTGEALEFFEGKKNISKKRVFTRGKDGQHIFAGDEGEKRSFNQYLEDFADRESALKEYSDALEAYRSKIKRQNV